MKIIELRSENVKRLKAVTIRPDGNLVSIGGKNGQGKTSVLDSILWAIEGAKHIQAKPVRAGAREAMIKLDLGEFVVRRVIHDDRTTELQVLNAKGTRVSSPQKLLDSLVGELSFDPLEFVRMRAVDQLSALRSFVKGVDFEAITEDRTRLYAERTERNRRSRDIKGEIAALRLPAGPAPKRVDIAALAVNLDTAGQQNADLEARRARREQAERDALRFDADAQALMERAAGYRKTAEQCEAEARTMVGEAEALRERLNLATPLPEPVDTKELLAKMGEATERNKVADQFDRRTRLEAALKDSENAALAVTGKIDELDRTVAAAITGAKLPVDGLALDESTVLLNGVPFEQASDAEQLRVSIAMAAAKNPALRVIRVRDGSLLDAEAMETLARFADEQDLQIWIERVGDDEAGGFIIEDGHLKGVVEDDPAEEAVRDMVARDDNVAAQNVGEPVRENPFEK